jgi:hypothetical protein
MAQITNKAQLIDHIQTERRRLQQNLDKLSPQDMLLPDAWGAWSVKDLLAHLAEWEGLFFGWYEAGKRGEVPVTPAPGVTWRNLDPLNRQIYEKHRSQSLESVLKEFHDTHQKLVDTIQAMSEEEIFTPGYYKWTARSALRGWFGAYASHDRWAKTEIREWMKRRSG